MNKAVIFDLDGVIVSTDAYHYKAWKKMADDEQLPFDEKLNHELRGVSRMESLEIILKNADKSNQFTDDEKLAMTNKKNAYYQTLLNDLDESSLLDGAIKTINVLKERNIPIAIASSSKNAKRILDALDLTESFDEIVDGTMIKNSKPDPEVFEKAKNMLGVKSSECFVVEDAVSGIEAAKAANMKAIAVNDARKSTLADYKLDTLDDLLKIID